MMNPGILLSVILLTFALPVFAQTGGNAGGIEEKQTYIYQWTDSQGVVHITDGLDKVPNQYRHDARRLESVPEEGAVPNRPGQQGASSPAGNGEEQRTAEQKAMWQQRMSAAKQKLAAAEQHYHEIDQRRTAMLGQWGTPAYAPPSARIEADRLAGELKNIQQEIDDARNQLEVVIPEEARKAGVPPGWLRE